MKLRASRDPSRPARSTSLTHFGLRITPPGSRLTLQRFNRSTVQRIRAYLLLECLVYLSAFTLVVGLSLTVFFRALDYSRELRRSGDDIVRALKAGERWRQDVREAVSPPMPTMHGGVAVLVIPQANDTVTYGLAQGTVWRTSLERSAPEPLLRDVKASRMEPDRRARVAAWRWELELATKKKAPRVKPLFTFLAVSARADTK
jgi:hypothetical protein